VPKLRNSFKAPNRTATNSPKLKKSKIIASGKIDEIAEKK
jgi:hypothetical protein